MVRRSGRLAAAPSAGVTRAVTASIQARLNGSQVQVAGKIVTDMTNFGISPPQVSITVVEPAVTIDFLLNFAQSA